MINKNVAKSLVLILVAVIFLASPTFVHAKENGAQYRYYDTGEVHIKMNFKNGELDGFYTEYDRRGEVIEQRLYDDGALVGNKNKDLEFYKEIIENLGPFRFIATFWFWLIVVAVGVIIWRVFVKIAFFDRPI